jgi:hypothetical protein
MQKNKKTMLIGLLPRENDAYFSDACLKRWGDNPKYREAKKRLAEKTEREILRIKNENEALLKRIAERVADKPESRSVQNLIHVHFQIIDRLCELNYPMYRSISELSVSDPEFREYYETYGVGMASFVHQAMRMYCDIREGGE